MQTIDLIFTSCYNTSSDRVADTCEACDRGNSCGNSLFYIKGCYDA